MPRDRRLWPVPTRREALWVHWLAWRNELPWRRPTRVEDGIWVGGVPTERRWRWLRARGVSRFVSVLGEVPPPTWLAEADGALWLRVPDRSAPCAEDLQQADDSLSHARALLLFCGSGVGRAPTTYLAWRVRSAADLDPEMVRLQGLRWITSPTGAQQAALRSWITQRGLR